MDGIVSLATFVPMLVAIFAMTVCLVGWINCHGRLSESEAKNNDIRASYGIDLKRLRIIEQEHAEHTKESERLQDRLTKALEHERLALDECEQLKDQIAAMQERAILAENRRLEARESAVQLLKLLEG